MRQLKQTTYINPVTGEYKEKKDWVDMYFDEEQGYLFWNRKAAIKSFIDVPLPSEFSWSERGRIQELKYYILRENQLLVYRSNSTIRPLGTKEMSKILGMSEKQCRLLISKAKRYNIIKEVSYAAIKYYAFNPMYGFKGKRLNLIVYIMFQEELKQVLPQWVISKFIQEVKELKPDIRVIR